MKAIAADGLADRDGGPIGRAVPLRERETDDRRLRGDRPLGRLGVPVRAARPATMNVVQSNVTSVRIETRRRSDGECIAEALDAPLSRSANGWLICLEVETSANLARFLSALQSCLGEQAIPAVTVALDDDRYVMEA